MEEVEMFDKGDEIYLDSLFKDKELFFRKVYEDYRRPLGAFLYRLVANKHQAEDLYQEVFQKFWTHILMPSKLLAYKEIGKWLFTTARNQVIDDYRRQNRLQSGPLEEVEQTLYEPISPEDLLCKQERLQWAFARMTVMYRICFVLQDIYGYTQKEIAASLYIAPQTVSTNVLRGRRQLLKLLSLYESHEGRE